MYLILASGSERRRELLSWLGLEFKVLVSGFDENSVKENDPSRLVKELALKKAQAVSRKLKLDDSGFKNEDLLVIGADTVVGIAGEIIGKPKNEEDAVRILRKLSGREHRVFTGVAVIVCDHGLEKKTKIAAEAEETKVTFRMIAEEEIRNYVASGEPFGKGGAYAIQMGAAKFVEKIEGSYTNVVGLPLLLLAKLLEKQGYKINKDIAGVIYKKTGYRS